MTVAIADGILGLEATVRIGGSYVINDLEAAFPRIKCTEMPGLHSLPPADNITEDNVGFGGATPYPSYVRPKTIGYVGEIQAIDQQTLSARRHSFKGATAERSALTLFEHIPHASYGTHAWAYYGRILANDIDEDIPVDSMSHIPSPYIREFNMSVLMLDPRFFLTTESYSSLGNDSGDTVAANNAGNAPADPTFVISGLTTNDQVDITNTSVNTSNGTARLRFFAVADGDLHVVFGSNPRAYIDTGADLVPNLGYPGFDSLYSQWWDELIPGLAPGNNFITVTGGAWDLTFLHRSW